MNTKIDKAFWVSLLGNLMTWNEAKKKEGFVPTVDLLLEDIKEIIKNSENEK